MDLPVTQAQLDCWRKGTPIQNAMPNLTAEQREFMMTGITPAEWEEEFGPDGEEEDRDQGVERVEDREIA